MAHAAPPPRPLVAPARRAFGPLPGVAPGQQTRVLSGPFQADDDRIAKGLALAGGAARGFGFLLRTGVKPVDVVALHLGASAKCGVPALGDFHPSDPRGVPVQVFARSCARGQWVAVSAPLALAAASPTRIPFAAPVRINSNSGCAFIVWGAQVGAVVYKTGTFRVLKDDFLYLHTGVVVNSDQPPGAPPEARLCCGCVPAPPLLPLPPTPRSDAGGGEPAAAEEQHAEELEAVPVPQPLEAVPVTAAEAAPPPPEEPPAQEEDNCAVAAAAAAAAVAVVVAADSGQQQGEPAAEPRPQSGPGRPSTQGSGTQVQIHDRRPLTPAVLLPSTSGSSGGRPGSRSSSWRPGSPRRSMKRPDSSSQAPSVEPADPVPAASCAAMCILAKQCVFHAARGDALAARARGALPPYTPLPAPLSAMVSEGWAAPLLELPPDPPPDAPLLPPGEAATLAGSVEYVLPRCERDDCGVAATDHGLCPSHLEEFRLAAARDRAAARQRVIDARKREKIRRERRAQRLEEERQRQLFAERRLQAAIAAALRLAVQVLASFAWEQSAALSRLSERALELVPAGMPTKEQVRAMRSPLMLLGGSPRLRPHDDWRVRNTTPPTAGAVGGGAPGAPSSGSPAPGGRRRSSAAGGRRRSSTAGARRGSVRRGSASPGRRGSASPARRGSTAAGPRNASPAAMLTTLQAGPAAPRRPSMQPASPSGRKTAFAATGRRRAEAPEDPPPRHSLELFSSPEMWGHFFQFEGRLFRYGKEGKGTAAISSLGRDVLSLLPELPRNWMLAFGEPVPLLPADIMCIDCSHLPPDPKESRKRCCLKAALCSAAAQAVPIVLCKRGAVAERLGSLAPGAVADGVAALVVYTHDNADEDGEYRRMSLHHALREAMRLVGCKRADLAQGKDPRVESRDIGTRMLRALRPLVRHLLHIISWLEEVDVKPFVFRSVCANVAPCYHVGSYFTWQEMQSASQSFAFVTAPLTAQSGRFGATLFVIAQRSATNCSLFSGRPDQEEVVWKPNRYYRVVARLHPRLLTLLQTGRDVVACEEIRGDRASTSQVAALCVAAVQRSRFCYDYWMRRFVEPMVGPYSERGAGKRRTVAGGGVSPRKPEAGPLLSGTVTLAEAFDKFLRSDRQVLLLGGQQGAGKLSAALASSARLLMAAAAGSGTQCPVPVFIPLALTGGDILDGAGREGAARRSPAPTQDGMPSRNAFMSTETAVPDSPDAATPEEEVKKWGDESGVLIRALTDSLHLEPQHITALKNHLLVVFLGRLDDLPLAAGTGSLRKLLEQKDLFDRGGVRLKRWPLIKWVITASKEFMQQHRLDLTHICGAKNARKHAVRMNVLSWGPAQRDLYITRAVDQEIELLSKRIKDPDVGHGAGAAMYCAPPTQELLDTMLDEEPGSAEFQSALQLCRMTCETATADLLKQIAVQDPQCLDSHFVTFMAVQAARDLIKRPAALQSAARWEVYNNWVQRYVRDAVGAGSASMEEVTAEPLQQVRLVLEALQRLCTAHFAVGVEPLTVAAALSHLTGGERAGGSEAFRKAMLKLMPLYCDDWDDDMGIINYRHCSLRDFLLSKVLATATTPIGVWNLALSQRLLDDAVGVLSLFAERCRGLSVLGRQRELDSVFGMLRPLAQQLPSAGQLPAPSTAGARGASTAAVSPPAPGPGGHVAHASIRVRNARLLVAAADAQMGQSRPVRLRTPTPEVFREDDGLGRPTTAETTGSSTGVDAFTAERPGLTLPRSGAQPEVSAGAAGALTVPLKSPVATAGDKGFPERALTLSDQAPDAASDVYVWTINDPVREAAEGRAAGAALPKGDSPGSRPVTAGDPH